MRRNLHVVCDWKIILSVPGTSPLGDQTPEVKTVDEMLASGDSRSPKGSDIVELSCGPQPGTHLRSEKASVSSCTGVSSPSTVEVAGGDVSGLA